MLGKEHSLSESIPIGICQCGCGQRTRVATHTSRQSGQMKGVPLRYIHGHNIDRPMEDAEYEKLWETAPVPHGYCWCGCGQATNLARYSSRKMGWKKGRPLPFLPSHFLKNRHRSPEYIEEHRGHETPCWIWQHNISPSTGYGVCWQNSTPLLAHRVYYKRFRGPIPRGLQIDHLCRVPPCVNPAHLEPVTNKENIRRGKGTKLNKEKVQKIRELAQTNGLTHSKIADMFGVSRQLIGVVVQRKRWGDVE